MRIAVVNEISTCSRNAAVVAALKETGCEVFNAGMTAPSETPELTYLQTGLISALLVHLELADLVIGGCGTGQGYLNSVLQYPGMTCALVNEPLDAWLARRINAPNCISLALNKGFGWAGEVNLQLLAEALLAPLPVSEQGYPPERAASQSKSRERLGAVSKATHHSMLQILRALDEEIVAPVYQCDAFYGQLDRALDSELKEYLLSKRK